MLQSGGIPNRPLVRVKSLQDIERTKELNQPQPNLATVASDTQLAGHIRLAWDRNKMAREKITQRLLASLRARRGVYSSYELQQIADRGGLNVIWVDLTEEKCKAAEAWISEVVVPVQGYPFAVEPSPLPDLPEEIKAQIVRRAVQEAQQTMQQIAQSTAGGGADGEQPMHVMAHDEFRQLAVGIGERMRDKIKEEYLKRAQKAADGMQTKIEDRMAEGGWEVAIKAFIKDFVTYPAAVLMGPVYERGNQLKWGPGLVPQVDRSPRQTWKWVDIFDCYPEQFSANCQKGNFIVRVRYTRRDLFDCIGLEDYREDQIRAALREYTNGHLEGWLWQESERQRLQQESLFTWLSPRGIIDGLHFWGSVPGFLLMQWGVKGMGDLDPVEEYEVDAILVGPYVIRCAINRDPLRRRPFYNASFDPIPGSFWGRAVPDLAETPQKMVNACACALADNMGWASGPMMWVHADRMADGENIVEMVPGKVHQLKSDPSQGVNPGIGVFVVPSNAEELQGLIEKWSIKADDSTGVPRYTYGNERVGGAADTYSGLSMLMNNAAKGLRRSIGSIDTDVIQPSVYSAFVNEMVFGDDDDIKADCTIVPKGATAMLVKEARNQAILSAASLTANPIDMAIIGAKGRAEILRKVMNDALEIGDEGIVPSDEEIDKNSQEQAQAQQQQVMVEAAAKQEDAKARLQLGREQIASNEKIKGAELAQKRLEARDRNKPKQVDFEYGPNGDVRAARLNGEPPEPAQAE